MSHVLAQCVKVMDLHRCRKNNNATINLINSCLVFDYSDNYYSPKVLKEVNRKG